MNVLEFKKRKAEMEADIACAIQGVVGAFKRDTGFSPMSISIELVETTEEGDSSRTFEIETVKTSVDI